MSLCIAKDRPQITILMAVYEPRIDWLRELLLSLNAQTYPNLQLYIRDDCSPTVPYEKIQSCVKDCISAFPYWIHRNEKNLGSNKTFERLTTEARGELFAYCDQDDIWLPEKLEVLENELAESGALLVCSDMLIIDGNGTQVAQSITAVRRHHTFQSGEGLAQGLLFSNFVTGCTMLIRSDAAKSAVPFCPYMIHDHYLALWCADNGVVISLSEPLIRYRIHQNNQTGLMSGVRDKISYGEVRIESALNKMLWLKEHFPCGKEIKDTIDESIIWLKARQSNWKGRDGASIVWKYRHFSPIPSTAEIFLRYLPDDLFMKFIELTRKNKV